MIIPLEQANIPCLLEDMLGRTIMTRTLGRKQSTFCSKVPLKMWFILTDSLLHIDSSGNRSANNWETWEITSFSNIGRIPEEQKSLKKAHPNAFIINLGTKSECFLIDCGSREQRVKWMEGIHALITMHKCEASMVGPATSSLVHHYIKLILAKVKQALRLTCQLRGIAKSLEEYYSGDSNPLQTANHELGKTALTSLGLLLQLVKSPFSFKTSEGAIGSCLKAWVDCAQAVTREGGGSLQLDLVHRKIEEQVTKILEMKPLTVADEVMWVFGEILERLRWTEKNVKMEEVIVVNEKGVGSGS